MTSLRILSISAVALLLFACGGGPQTGQDQGGNQVDTAQTAQDAEPATVRESADATNIAALEAVEESASEPAASQAGTDDAIVLTGEKPDKESENKLAWQYDAKKHFTILTTAQGTSSPPDQIEVAEVFWYGCSHCFNFDPYIKKWQENLPDDINFLRLPVIWNPTNQVHARLFYTAEALGKLEEMHEEIFREIHINNQTLSTEASIQKFFLRFGVSEEEFKRTFRSFAVESKLKRAKNLTQRYRIQSVPLLVTNGKYLTQGPEIRNFDDMLAVTEELVERERQEL